MRDLPASALSLLQARRGFVSARFVDIEARNIVTGAAEFLRIWSGGESITIAIGGELRTYLGAGELLDPEPVTAASGLEVRVYQLRMAAVAPEVEDLVKGYQTRGARVELHRAIFDPLTMELAGAPSRLMLGVINTIDFPRGLPGELAACVVEVVPETRQLTFGNPAKKSDADQSLRSGDRFRRYADISGSIPVYWGEKYL